VSWNFLGFYLEFNCVRFEFESDSNLYKLNLCQNLFLLTWLLTQPTCYTWTDPPILARAQLISQRFGPPSGPA
jgi:hypothetical protein